ncbi:hypothetical protein M3Y96_00522800 [Aphelenchoides besseyi]|nr:hypothetical protein M3Y96_00522800 [Aphelenchoides besseyi]
MSDRNLAPSAPGSSSSSKIKTPRRSQSKKSTNAAFQKSCRFNPELCNHKNPKSKAKCWRYNQSFSPRAAKKRAEKIGPWELSSTTPAIRSPIPISPSSSASPVSPIVPVSSGSSISSTPSAIKVNTSEAVRKINCYIDDVYHGKVDEHGVPITCEWYAKLILKSSCEVKPTNSAVFSASEKAKIPKDNGTIDVSMSMAVNNEQTVKQSQKGRKKPSN